MTTQLDLFSEAKVSVAKPEPMTPVRVGSRVAQIPLHKRRRKACNRLMEILADLEGKDVHIGSYDAGGRHFRVNNLKLPRLQLEWYPQAGTLKTTSPASYRLCRNYVEIVLVQRRG